MKVSLSISGKMHLDLKNHLYPGDGKEAVAIALCGRYKSGQENRLLVHKVLNIPYEECSVRTPDRVSWSTERVVPLLEIAAKKNLAILKIHSHPGGYEKFSNVDDNSDTELFASVFGWMDTMEPHASAIMLPDGKVFGRVVDSSLNFTVIDKVTVVGDDIMYWFNDNIKAKSLEFEKRTAQTFGDATTSLLKKLSVAVVGCSGTGSPVIEQLARLGIGKIVLIDPDVIEKKNLNRILNSAMLDAENNRLKVDVAKESIERMGLGTEVVTFSKNLYSDEDVRNAIMESDAVFGCMDSIDGRHLLNQIATFYLIPYFDLGVKIISNGKGGISQICGTIHYLQPGLSSLMTRGVYGVEELRAAGMLRMNPAEYKRQKSYGYIVDVKVDSPAVISINMQIASMAVTEFLARIHPFRYDSNKEFAVCRVSMSDGYYQREEEGTTDPYLLKFVGRGHLSPVLNMPELN